MRIDKARKETVTQRGARADPDGFWSKVVLMQKDRELPIQNDDEALDLVYGTAVRLLVISKSDTARSWQLFFAGHDVNLIEIVDPGSAAARLDKLIAIEAVWIELDDEPAPPELVVRLQHMRAQGDLQIIWVGHDAALEQGHAAFETGVPLLSCPTEIERLTAAAMITSARRFALNDISGDSDAAQIQRLTEEVNRIAKMLGVLAKSHGLSPPSPLEGGSQVRSPADSYVAEPSYPFRAMGEPAGTDGEISASDVRRLIRVRRLRDQFFPSEIFADPAWDMLLDLMAARLARNPVSVSSLCIAAAVPATTALRWIRTLTESGLFVRYNDPQDGRRVFIGLSDEAAEGMLRYFATVKTHTGTIG